MAPTWRSILTSGADIAFNSVRRGALINAADDTTASANASSTSDSLVYLGIGLGIGVAFLLGVTALLILIVKKRADHQRMLAAMEVERASSHPTQAPPLNSRPLSGCSTLINPLQTRAGWGALSSNETVNHPEEVPRTYERKRRSISSLPKKLMKKPRGIPLKALKRLTAILESPRGRTRTSPQIPAVGTMPKMPVATDPNAPPAAKIKAFNLQGLDEDDVFVCPESPKPHVLPSFAIRSPGRYGAGIANGNNRNRSQSVGAMPAVRGDPPLEWSSRTWPTSFHTRSVSLGIAPLGRPPSGPVPPLPVISPHDDIENQDLARQGVFVQRISSSSHGTSQSSVLMTATPILIFPEQNQPLASPTVEEIVAEDGSALLKNVSPGGGARPTLTKFAPGAGAKQHTSIHANIARYSAESLANRRISCTFSGNHLSIARIDTADQVSISRVSSSSTLQGGLGVRKVTTSRRLQRTSVSASGSPVERKKANVLRDISTNSLGPSRQPSNATQDSSRSSNGNPFQWDLQPLARPSALKGSPNARKGHRRQNCVRISTLTPQILGTPRSWPTSPSIMHGIEEESGESGDGDDAPTKPGARFVSNQRISRPPSSSSFAPNIRIEPFRASLTPSSPTLSAWTVLQEHGLPPQNSDSQLSVSVGTTSMSHLSNRSSAFSIPCFPSPVKAATSTTQLSRPIPEFYLSRPSTDAGEDGSSPCALNLSPDLDVPSSPPLPISKDAEYDSAWRMPRINIASATAYDPASATWPTAESERSSVSLPFAVEAQSSPAGDDTISQIRKISSGSLVKRTSPSSPDMMPEGFQAFFDKSSKATRARENLTSANASAIMARAPSPSRVDFPGAPILSPPKQDAVYDQLTPMPRQRSTSHGSYLVPARPAPAPHSPSEEDYVPSPLHIAGKISPTGPRSQPANSVLKNAMALRRMNSEITIADRSSRRFVQLGREASPLLPWIGTPDLDDNGADTKGSFDFDFSASDAISGAEYYDVEIDTLPREVEVDGPLAGIATLPSACNSSVREDGEKYWTSTPNSNSIGVAKISPLVIEATPDRSTRVPESPRSIQCTPRSLYDSDGFLKG